MTKGEIDLLVYKYIGVDSGYLRGFSYSEHDRFYVEYCDAMEVDVGAARRQAGTTRAAFIHVLENVSPNDQARVIRGVLSKFPLDAYSGEELERKSALAAKFVALAARLEGNVVASNQPLVTSDTVQRALSDAETLLRSNGPVSAVDRVHTALHGHLAHLCREVGIATGDDPSVTSLWTLLINQHPAIQLPEPRREDIRRVLRSGSSIVDAVHTIRNRASVAHPNGELIGDDEAWLVINLVRSLFHYLDAKTKAV